jgi:ectoine hydroxylase-related dioxygenase (phytanoyl-CoA dioxygenase family)
MRPGDDVACDFLARGYAVLPHLFTPHEVAELARLFDLSRTAGDWKPTGRGTAHQDVNADPLATTFQIDHYLRHPAVLDLLGAVLGGTAVLHEVSWRYMPSRWSGEVFRHWHRDKPRTCSPPVGAEYVQLLVYLSDVGADGHCFTLCPEAADSNVGRPADAVDVLGRAGTCVLFDVSLWHTMTARVTPLPRKSMQAYYAGDGAARLSEYTSSPRYLWNNPDPDVRQFYGVLRRG